MQYLYKFLDPYNKVNYIGRTKNLDTRIFSQHFSEGNGHLPDTCYKETTEVLYAELNPNSARIYEIYLINKLEPKYNTTFNNNEKFDFSLPDLNWKELSFSDLEDTKEEKGYRDLKKTLAQFDNKFSKSGFNDTDIWRLSEKIAHLSDLIERKGNKSKYEIGQTLKRYPNYIRFLDLLKNED